MLQRTTDLYMETPIGKQNENTAHNAQMISLGSKMSS